VQAAVQGIVELELRPRIFLPATSPVSRTSCVDLEHNRLDERSNGVRRARATLLLLESQTEAANLLAIDVGHAWVP
jgi:hypothetical protein